MTKFFVTADNHIGRHLKKRKTLRDFAINNFKLIPDKIPNDVEYVIFAGDVFDKENTDIECYNAYIEVLSKINSMPNIKNIFVITGNHDQYSNFYNSASIDVAQNVGLSKVILCNNDYYVWQNERFLITLLPYNRSLFVNNEVGTKNIIDKLNDVQFGYNDIEDKFKILVSHFAITDWMPFATMGMSMEELVGNNFYNLIVMGDLHNEDFEKISSDTSVLYTGSTFHTSISDLYNHNNVAKIITVDENNGVEVERVTFPKPPVVKITKDNIGDLRDELNEKYIVLTDDIDLHNELKDRVLYSMYSPKDVVKEITQTAERTSDEPLDILEICTEKIRNDESLSEESKNCLIELLKLDTESLDNNDLFDKCREIVLGDLA